MMVDEKGTAEIDDLMSEIQGLQDELSQADSTIEDSAQNDATAEASASESSDEMDAASDALEDAVLNLTQEVESELQNSEESNDSSSESSEEDPDRALEAALEDAVFAAEAAVDSEDSDSEDSEEDFTEAELSSADAVSEDESSDGLEVINSSDDSEVEKDVHHNSDVEDELARLEADLASGDEGASDDVGGTMSEFHAGSGDASMEDTLADLDSVEPEDDLFEKGDVDESLGTMNDNESDDMDNVHPFPQSTYSSDDVTPEDGVLTMSLQGSMRLKLRYEFEGTEVVVGFEDGALKVALDDGTEFKVPVNRRRRVA